MFRIQLLIVALYFGSVSTFFYSDIVLDEDLHVEVWCKSKICIRKCCGNGEFVIQENDTTICDTFDSESKLINPYYKMLGVAIYDNEQHDLKVNKNLSDVFLLVPGKFNEELKEYENLTFAQLAFVATDAGFNVYLNEGGTLYFEFPNAYSRWTPIEKSNYCVDVDSDLNPKFWSVMTSEDATENNEYYTGGIIISSVFLVAVFLVYAILPELQNLAGLVLMAYVFSLGAAFIILACLQLIGMDVLSCIVLTGMCYFFFLSTFCWMNIMSYDIWWTFRGYAKARTIHRRGVRFKFIMYCLYAYGVPTLMTIGLMTVNSLDLRRYPWIITPQIPKFGCFIEGGQKFVYLYIPMLVLILCNWMFYLMTAFNIWRLVRGTAILNSTHRSQKNRLMVYLKISVIMGINWLLEVVSFLTPKLTIWLYTDAYNVLMGFSIFLIFVWKRKIYRKLKARLTPSPIVRKVHHSSMSSTLESSLGQETSTVSINPRGK